MNHLNQLERWSYLHRLIQRKMTGTPKELAAKLNISERQLYKDLQVMKERGLPITYSYRVESYVYEEEIDFYFGFKQKEMDQWIWGGKN